MRTLLNKAEPKSVQFGRSRASRPRGCRPTIAELIARAKAGDGCAIRLLSGPTYRIYVRPRPEHSKHLRV